MTGDCTLKSLTLSTRMPSISTLGRGTLESISAAATWRSALRSQSFRGIVGSQSNAPAPYSVLVRGMMMALPAGTVQVRRPMVGAGDAKAPPKNQTGPAWPSPQFWPVVSKFGFWGVGMAINHCHQRALHSPYVFPKGLASRGKMVGRRSSSCAWATGTMATPIRATAATAIATIWRHRALKFIRVLLLLRGGLRSRTKRTASVSYGQGDAGCRRGTVDYSMVKLYVTLRLK